MGTVERRMTEDDLQAYVDGRLGPARTILVERHLRANPQTALCIKSYCRARRELQDVLSAKAKEPIPRRLRVNSIAARLRRARLARYRQVAIACLCIALGILLGWIGHDIHSSEFGFSGTLARAEALRRDAISAHRFLTAVIRSDAFSTAEETQLRRWLHRRLGAPFSIPNLSVFGMRFLGGQILPHREDNAIAVLSYGDDQGASVTIYLRAGEHRGTDLHSARLDDTVVFYWFDKHCAYAVVAIVDLARLSRIAHAIFDHFEAPHAGGRTAL